MNRFHRSRLRYFLLAVLFVVVALGCDGGPDADDRGEPGTVDASGVVELPARLNASDYRLRAGLNTGQIDDDGGYSIRLNDDAVQMLSVADEAGVPVLISVRSVGTTASDEPINATTTAEALVFMNPLFATSHPAEATALKNDIRSLESFAALVGAIEAELQAGTFSLRTPGEAVSAALAETYAELRAAFEAAYEAKLGKLEGPTPGYEVSGLEVIDVQDQTGQFTFKIRNGLKRWIAVYADRSADGETFETKGALDFDDLLPSPGISIFQLIKDGGSSLTSTSGPINVSTSGYERVAVKCYGLGVGFPTDEDVERERFLLPSVASVVFDIGLPVFEIITGINSLDADISSNPSEHPFFQLVKEELTNISGNSALVGKLYGYWESGDYVNVIVDVAKEILTRVADQPRILTDILVEMGFQNVVAEAVDSWLWPIRLANATVTAANLGFTLGSIISAEALTTFAFDVTGGPVGSMTVRGTVVDAGSGVNAAVVTVLQNNVQQTTVRTNVHGGFRFQVDPGTYRIRATKDGYLPVDQEVDIPNDGSGEIGGIQLVMTPRSEETGTIGGQVRDALTGDPVDAVTVTLRRGANLPNGSLVETTETDANGSYGFGGLDAGTYTAFFEKEGYINESVVSPVYGGETIEAYNVTISPAFTGTRIVLEWGENPRDLDSHLYTPTIEGSTYHVFYADKGAEDEPPYAVLDVDDVSSFGPETITISRGFNGTYTYAVHKYAGEGPLSASSATVKLLLPDGQSREWTVPESGSGRWWTVFRLDGTTGAITTVDELGDGPIQPPGSVIPSFLKLLPKKVAVR